MHWQLQNSIVSRQCYEEASKVLLSQPFRFTADCGWIVLYHFLQQLDVKHRCQFLSVTVCHPAFASLPEINPRREADSQGFVNCAGNYLDLFDEHVEEFGFGPALRQPYPPLSQNCTWTERGQFDGTARSLSKCANLRRLSLTLPQYQHTEDQPSSQGLANHPIHSYQWPQGKDLSLFILHLVSSRHDCSDHERFQPCMAKIYEQPCEKKSVEERPMRHTLPPLSLRPDPSPTMLRVWRLDMRQFFDAVKEQG